MAANSIGKYTVSFGLSLAVMSVLNGLLVIVKETHEDSVLALMKRLTPHHWITHGIFVIVAFVALGWLFSRANGGQGIQIPVPRLIALLVGAVVVGGALIAGFYLIEG
jgi:cytochrome bd-type quinol oxidase subunit 2